MLALNQKSSKKIIIYLILIAFMLFGIGFFSYKIINLNKNVSFVKNESSILLEDSLEDEKGALDQGLNEKFFNLEFIKNEKFENFKKIIYNPPLFTVGNQDPFLTAGVDN